MPHLPSAAGLGTGMLPPAEFYFRANFTFEELF